MDVGREEHRAELQRRQLLFGVVTYAAGRLGEEPVRSQGHVHRVASHSGWSPPELYEIWAGRAVVYMQEQAADDPGRCFAIEAGPGEVVVVPPGWAHATVSADAREPMTFGAWCDREYGFEYAEVRARGGLACFPLLGAPRGASRGGGTRATGAAARRAPGTRVPGARARAGEPIYQTFARDPEAVQWVSDPARVAHAVAGVRAVKRSGLKGPAWRAQFSLPRSRRGSHRESPMRASRSPSSPRLRRAPPSPNGSPCRSTAPGRSRTASRPSRRRRSSARRWPCPGSSTTRRRPSRTWTPSTASSWSTTRSPRSCCPSRRASRRPG